VHIIVKLEVKYNTLLFQGEREGERKTDRPHTRPQLENIGLKSAKESEKSEL
jgi:hypothetical protein